MVDVFTRHNTTRRDTAHVGILHYTAPPVVGGVEAVIQAHVGLFAQAGYPVTVIAGRGQDASLPGAAGFALIPKLDSQHPEIVQATQALVAGNVPPEFESLVETLVDSLRRVVMGLDVLIVHNVFSKHFNLPLTAALFRLLEAGVIGRCLAWSHDFTWTSPNSRRHVHSGFPWDLLRRPHPRLTYVTISKHRQAELAALLEIPPEQIHVVYNGIDPGPLFGLDRAAADLVQRTGLLEADLIILMPVRVTQAKNIELAIEVVSALKAGGMRPRLIVTGPPDPHDPLSLDYFNSLQGQRTGLGLQHEFRFVYELGLAPDQPLTIDYPTTTALLRLCDVVFIPSHREGFGLPILEAALVGAQVFTAPIPAAVEIGSPNVTLIDPAGEPVTIARQIIEWSESNPNHQLRRRVRQQFTWPAIFERQIEPLLVE